MCVCAFHLLRRPEYPSHFFLPPELAALSPRSPFHPLPPKACPPTGASWEASHTLQLQRLGGVVLQDNLGKQGRQRVPGFANIDASTHPRTAVLASPSTRSFLIFPMSHGRSASLPSPPSFLFSPFCSRIAWIACPAVRVRRQTTAARSTQAHRRFRTPSRCLHQPATLTPLGAVSKKRTWPSLALVSSFRRLAVWLVRSLVRSLHVRHPPHQCALHGRLQLGPPRNGPRRQDTRCETVRLQHAAEAYKSFACDNSSGLSSPAFVTATGQPSAPSGLGYRGQLKTLGPRRGGRPASSASRSSTLA